MGSDELAPGEVLDGRYRIVRELGGGAMGIVFVAEHLALGSQVAVKVLRPEFSSESDLVARFEQEARAASALGHGSIVHVFDLGRTTSGARYMVMELLEGRSLASVLEDDGPMGPARALEVMGQILDGLVEAHRHGIVHRDLKPENIFIVERPGQPAAVKLLDFGISKVMAGMHTGMARSTGTTVGMILGTPAYMSPEQARGDVHLVDPRTDLYAAGVVLYELLVGRPPFDGDNAHAVLASVIAGTHSPLATVRPGVPPAVSALVTRAMARDPKDRFADASEMRASIRQAASWSAPEAPRSAPAWRLPSDLKLETVALDDVAPTEPAPIPEPAPAAPAPPPLDASMFAPPPVAVQSLALAERPTISPARPGPGSRSVATTLPPRAQKSSLRGFFIFVVVVLALSVAYKLVVRGLSAPAAGNAAGQVDE